MTDLVLQRSTIVAGFPGVATPATDTTGRAHKGAARKVAVDAARQFAWAPGVAAEHVTVAGSRIRYIAVGQGPPLLLLHTVRAQLDMFQKVIPELARQFRVYAPDFPGHGHSDAPEADYSAEFLSGFAGEFLDRLNLQNVIVAGESIGGTSALLLAARRHPRIRGVVAINPYDYDRGRGLRRSSVVVRFMLAASRLPLLGNLVRRRQPFAVLKRILRSGVVHRNAVPPALVRELHDAGSQPDHARAFEQLVRNARSWEQARTEYRNIALPVLLLYGDDDWSREVEREANRRTIPGARIRFIDKAGHFLALDAPDAFRAAVLDFAARLSSPAFSRKRRVQRVQPA